ncbi:hypothetical protein L1787_07445 [Acuticoccus sp. M5D2P5]|uniref:hypothetical protein n=1 Tax=Acuticoccus kalidii TaxID=2910977 RepID=UPI001F2876A7|nr:hypothetical protein [Acuticoccus kalidii]MCF3933244.1 hypothetical protein [Acuticoccus kalidii]
MLNETIGNAHGTRVILMDSISLITAEDGGTIIVSASHGGRISAGFAAKGRPLLVFFNDAGGGKGDAGRAAVALLEEAGIACASVDHRSARIGDARDHYDSGRVSARNERAARAGIAPGDTVRDAVERFAAFAAGDTTE